MAVSFRIVVALGALLVFALVYGVGQEVVGIVEPLASGYYGGDGSGAGSNNLFVWTTTIWGLLPVFALLAVGGYILKQAVVVRG
jgi:ABC-type microcin C transport system permease subunit YejE